VGITAQLDVNRRQRDETEREAAALMRRGEVDAAFARLGERIVESADPVKAAVEQYLALSPAAQEKTAIITAGHRLRLEALGLVRGALLERGQLGTEALTLKTWEPQHLSSEDLRHIHNWQCGMQLRLYRGQAGLERGTYTVGLVDARSNRVELRAGPAVHFVDPRAFKANARGAELERPSEIEVRAGDLLRFTDRDDSRGVVRGTAARVSGIHGGLLTLTIGDRTVELGAGDRLRERLDHAAVLNAYKTQGKSIDRVIAVMDTSSRLLASPFNAYVMVTRQKDELTLHTNDKDELARQIRDHEGGPVHGLDVAEASEREQPKPDILDLTPEQSARVERDTNRMSEAIAGLGETIKQRIARIGIKPEPEREEPREPVREIEIERQPDRSHDWGIGD
jgi:AraC-like DNA-binding protein